MTERHQQSDMLEQDSQGPIFNLCDADIHDLRRLKRSSHAQSRQPDQGTLLRRRTH